MAVMNAKYTGTKPDFLQGFYRLEALKKVRDLHGSFLTRLLTQREPHTYLAPKVILSGDSGDLH